MKQRRETPRTSKGLFDHLKTEKKGLFEKKESKISESNRIREELKERFTAVGILSCELNLIGCMRSSNFGFGWTFAHSLKRDKMAPAHEDPELRNQQMREVIYACVKCHDIIEKLGNKENKMYNIVREIIGARTLQP